MYFFICLLRLLYYEWMYSIMNSVHLKARLVWSGTCLTIRNMPIIRGQILGRAWPVGSWWSPAASALPELSLHPEIPSFSPRSENQISWWNVQDCQISYLRSYYRANESQGSAVCSSNFFFFERIYFLLVCFERSFFPIHDIWDHNTCFASNVLNPLTRQTLRIRILVLDTLKEKIPALSIFHSILTGLYFCKKKKDMDWKQALTQTPSWSRGRSGGQLR